MAEHDPFESRRERFTNSNTFDLIALAVGVLLSALCVAGVVWAARSTNDPAYEPPSRVSYQIGELR